MGHPGNIVSSFSYTVNECGSCCSLDTFWQIYHKENEKTTGLYTAIGNPVSSCTLQSHKKFQLSPLCSCHGRHRVQLRVTWTNPTNNTPEETKARKCIFYCLIVVAVACRWRIFASRKVMRFQILQCRTCCSIIDVSARDGRLGFRYCQRVKVAITFCILQFSEVDGILQGEILLSSIIFPHLLQLLVLTCAIVFRHTLLVLQH